MASKHCTLEISASPWNQKIATLSQEVVRRLLNTSEELKQEDKNNILNEFGRKMRRSGYIKIQISEILISGIQGYKRKWEGRVNRHRRGEETEAGRRRKKLTGKTN